MRKIVTRTGAELPTLGQGTFQMGQNPLRRKEEIVSLQLGIDLGMTLIDTAEMYASGASERVVAEAIAGSRDEVFLVTKVLPGNASRIRTRRSCEASLRRLRTDRIDLYLLHWKNSSPLDETIETFQMLRDEGKILHFGVSNFDIDDMNAAEALPGGDEIACDQVLYNLSRRSPEWELIDWCRQRGVAFMAYTPLERMRIARNGALSKVAQRVGATPAQIAIAWTLRLPGVVTIPKAGTVAHVRENAAAAALTLDDAELNLLDRAFPPPDGPQPIGFL